MKIGYDLGNTITSKTLLFPHIIEGAFEVIRKLSPIFEESYIISRVNSAQRDRALNWFETTDFFNQTLIKEENVYFCFDRRDKTHFVKSLEIDYFIDDRPEVLSFMGENVTKILFNPNKEDLEKYRERLNNYYIVKNWAEVEELLVIHFQNN